MFLPESFKPNSFLPTSWRMGATPTTDGRSGYWRLFYTKLQEEALKKHDTAANAELVAKSEVAANEVSGDGIARKPAQRDIRKKNRVRTRKVAAPAQTLPFRPAPVVHAPTVHEILAELPQLDFNHFSSIAYNTAKIYDLNSERELKKKRQQLFRRRAAAFLLLAA